MSSSINNNPPIRSTIEHAICAIGYLVCALGIVGVVVLAKHMWNQPCTDLYGQVFPPDTLSRMLAVIIGGGLAPIPLTVLGALTFGGDPSTYDILKDRIGRMAGAVKDKVAARMDFKRLRRMFAQTEDPHPL